MISFKDWTRQLLDEAKLPFDRYKRVQKKLKKSSRKQLAANTIGMDIEFGPYVSEENEEPPEISFWHNSNGIISYLQNNGSYRSGYGFDRAFEDYTEVYDHERPLDVDTWEKHNPEPLTFNEWEQENPEPDEEDEDAYSEWENAAQEAKDEYEKWEEDKSEAEQEYDDWEPSESFAYWLGEDNWEEYVEDFWQLADYLGIEREYENLTQTVIDNMEDQLSDYIDEDDLIDVIEVDAADTVELTTNTMTRKDLPRLLELLTDLKAMYLETANNMSAHIHIGFPKNFSIVNEINLFTLVDEEKIFPASGRSESSMDTWSKLSPKVLQTFKDNLRQAIKANGIILRNYTTKVYDHENGGVKDVQKVSHVKGYLGIEKKTLADGEYFKSFRGNTTFLTKEELRAFMGVHRSRTQGVNLTNAMEEIEKYRRVEFRYMTSELLDNPKDIMSWINYFMTVVNVASKRNRVSIALPEDNLTVVIAQINEDRFRLRIKRK